MSDAHARIFRLGWVSAGVVASIITLYLVCDIRRFGQRMEVMTESYYEVTIRNQKELLGTTKALYGELKGWHPPMVPPGRENHENQ